MRDEKKFIKERLTNTPPSGCPFMVGDIVTYTNEYGVKFKNKKIIGFDTKETLAEKIKTNFLKDRFIYLSGEAFWFPSTLAELKKES